MENKISRTRSSREKRFEQGRWNAGGWERGDADERSKGQRTKTTTSDQYRAGRNYGLCKPPLPYCFALLFSFLQLNSSHGYSHIIICAYMQDIRLLTCPQREREPMKINAWYYSHGTWVKLWFDLISHTARSAAPRPLDLYRQIFFRNSVPSGCGSSITPFLSLSFSLSVHFNSILARSPTSKKPSLLPLSTPSPFAKPLSLVVLYMFLPLLSWPTRESNLPYFISPARRLQDETRFFIRMTPFCPSYGHSLPISFDPRIARLLGSHLSMDFSLGKCPLSVSFSGPATITEPRVAALF